MPRELGNVYWYSAETDNGILRGHVVKKNCVLEVANDFCFDIKDVWSIVLPSESEKIAATATRSLNEATVAPKAVSPVGSVTLDESSLVVYLIDTVTGCILHRMTHHGSQGPVHAVFSENWVVYHYFNLRAHRYEMSVIEIYDQAGADNKDMLKLVFGTHNLTSPITAYSRPEVFTKSQSYFFTHSVKTMAVTSTVKGITSKQILLGTIGDQVLALDKRFLDPRRTLNPTATEKEEGIIPLIDSLPVIPQSYVTHALKVEGNVISILMFASPITTFKEVVKKKSTENYNGLPYIITLLSTSLWSFYGILKPGGLLVLTVNAAGAALHVIYVILFIIYAPKISKVKSAKLAGAVNVVFFGAVIIVTLVALRDGMRITLVGFLCAALTVGMYAAPLSVMRTVIKTKSVKYMPFFLTFFQYLNAGVWSAYSVLIKDFYIGVPNGIGFILGSAQLILYIVYKNKSTLEEKIEEDEKEGSAHLFKGAVEMQDNFDEPNMKSRSLIKGSSLPKPSLVRQYNNNIIKARSLSPDELGKLSERDIEKGINDNQ
ncbi:hypothetical protein BUALT_Bualt19G0066400 [Buddleja alternifolia]|uniref:ER membrane protein complex subunit 1 n=1 Tax=Buddleja alternifolia TaxID=168488 RepID=A0AAV6W813_9LAMI|nr:hypothetical protein BUALT_Bualt19G0066400 [Buddleja alternifolia]